MNLPPALSKAATLALLQEYGTAPNDRRAVLEDTIVKGNLRFCAYQARRYQQPQMELDDLVAIAAAALLDAVRRFDPTKSSHFAAYARRCIRRDLAVAVRREGSPIRLPREPHAGEKAAGRKRVESPIPFALDSLATSGSVRHIHQTRRAPASETEEGLIGQARSGITHRPVFGHDLVTENPEDSLNTGIDAERIAGLIASLPERDATVVRMRFGLDGMAPHELAEIGAVLSISKQRVQAILDRAIAALRVTLKAA